MCLSNFVPSGQRTKRSQPRAFRAELKGRSQCVVSHQRTYFDLKCLANEAFREQLCGKWNPPKMNEGVLHRMSRLQQASKASLARRVVEVRDPAISMLIRSRDTSPVILRTQGPPQPARLPPHSQIACVGNRKVSSKPAVITEFRQSSHTVIDITFPLDTCWSWIFHRRSRPIAVSSYRLEMP